MTWTVGAKVVQVISSVSTRQRIGLQARLGQAAGMLARRWLSSPCHPAAQNEQWCAAAKSVVTCDCNGTSDSTRVPLNDGQGRARDDGLPVPAKLAQSVRMLAASARWSFVSMAGYGAFGWSKRYGS